MARTKGYDAFITYNRASGSALALAFRSGLHRLAKPWWKLRATHVFLDRSETRTGTLLRPEIEQALARSRHLIVVASPGAAASEWVGQEIEWWCEAHPNGVPLLVLQEGTIEWDDGTNDFDWSATIGLPRGLARRYAQEPRYEDLRALARRDPFPADAPEFREAVLGLSAALRDSSPAELDAEDVRQHRRALRAARAAAVVLLVLSVVAIRLWRVAEERRQIAVAGRCAAQAQLVKAESPELAALVAVEAMKRDPDLAAEPRVRGLACLPRWYTPWERFENRIESRRLRAIRVDRDGEWVMGLEQVFLTGPMENLRVWSSETGKVLLEQLNAGGLALDVARSAGEEAPTLLLGADDGRLHVWRGAGDAQPLDLPPVTGEEPELPITMSPDGEHFSFVNGQTVTLHQFSSAKPIATLEFDSPFRTVFTPDGAWLLTMSRLDDAFSRSKEGSYLIDWRIGGVRVQDRSVTCDIELRDSAFPMLATSADGKWLATGFRRIEVWVIGGERSHVLDLGIDDMLELKPSVFASTLPAISSGGDRFAMALDNVVWLWRTESGALDRRLSCHGRVQKVLFSPDGNWLVVAESSSVHLLEVRSNQGHDTLLELGDTVVDVAFAPNGSWLVAGTEECRVAVWPWPIDDPMSYARRCAGRALTPEEEDRFLR